jgi:hypothetical protein
MSKLYILTLSLQLFSLPTHTYTLVLAYATQTGDIFGGACGDFEVFSDGFYMERKRQYCFEPVLLGALDNLYRHHPNATVLYITRNVDEWLSSVHRWYLLGKRLLKNCRGPGYFTQWQEKELDYSLLVQMYKDHGNKIREFVAAHPSLTYIEVSLESNETGRQLEDVVGIPKECWTHSNVNAFHPKT